MQVVEVDGDWLYVIESTDDPDEPAEGSSWWVNGATRTATFQ